MSLSRRGLLASLAALPFLRWLPWPKREAWVARRVTLSVAEARGGPIRMRQLQEAMALVVGDQRFDAADLKEWVRVNGMPPVTMRGWRDLGSPT